MVAIAPFHGYIYNKEEILNYGTYLTAPPYDVLTPSEREVYYQSHPHNILHVDLGRVLPEDPDPMTWHGRSASLLNEWLAQKVLTRREKPTFFLLETEFSHPLTGKRLIRNGFVALLRLEEPLREARVRLHEQTFSFHKLERLDLMRKTRAQLSPLFGFFPDPESKILNNLSMLRARGENMQIRDTSAQVHRVTFLEDGELLAQLTQALADKTVYIADGHHRYMTALNYQKEITANLKSQGLTPPAQSALNYVMIYLCPMGDPGLVVLPTHRILKRLDRTNEEILHSLAPYAEIRVFSYSEGGKQCASDALMEKLQEDKKKGLTVFGLFLNGSDFCAFIKIKEKIKEALADEAPEKAKLSLLDVSILTNVVLIKALGLTEELMDEPDRISYISQVDQAFNLVNAGSRAAFILNPTSLQEILTVTESGFVMPRKATYFYPKVSNGLVINLLDPFEVVGKA
ncbi:MAG: DUF1015 domain-containing protein [Deltaproteobacteria bacterium]|jgi:uncharacterized protein (DUF1015 family)|nr:DUF1015 domain-containing protein [Deltaproteobacteria bacterium]